MTENQVALIENETGSLVKMAAVLQVRNSDENEKASEVLGMIRKASKMVGLEFDDQVALSYQAYKKIYDLREKYQKPLKKAETFIKGKQSSWIAEQRRIQAQMQRELEEKARKEAEKEKAKLLKKTEKAANKGDTKKVEELTQKIEEVVPVTPVVAEIFTKADKQIVRDNFIAEIFDETQIPREYLMPDMKKITEKAKEMKQEGIFIKGVKFVNKPSVTTRI